MPLHPFDDHHPGRHQDQGRVHQRGQLGAAAEAVGEAGRGRPGAEPFGPPAEQQAGHIPEVVDGIADQGQGPEADADRQLQPREGAVQQHPPEEGPGRTLAVGMPVLVLVLV
jgi:hypothetical protein